MSAAEDRSRHASLLARNAELERIIKPLPESVYQCDVPWRGVMRSLESMAEGYGEIDLEPDFQRGHVWTASQQREWIEAALRRALPSSALVVQFNCPGWSDGGRSVSSELPTGFQCIDGL